MSGYEVRNQGGVFTVLVDGAPVARDLNIYGVRKLASTTEDKDLARICRVAVGDEAPRVKTEKTAEKDAEAGEPNAGDPEPKTEAKKKGK